MAYRERVSLSRIASSNKSKLAGGVGGVRGSRGVIERVSSGMTVRVWSEALGSVKQVELVLWVLWVGGKGRVCERGGRNAVDRK